MHLLLVDPVNKKLARDFMQEYKEKGYGKNVLKVSEEQFYSFIYYGKLGELVFRDMLILKKIPHECKDILKPYPGKFKRNSSDFVLTLTGETIDVKTAEEPYKIRLLVREDQFRARRYNIYIGQRAIDSTKIECWGYITREELDTVPPSDKFGYGPCRHWLLKDLHSIDDFIIKAKVGRKFT